MSNGRQTRGRTWDEDAGWVYWDEELQRMRPWRPLEPAPTEDATYDRTYGTAGQVSSNVTVTEPEPDPYDDIVWLGDIPIPRRWTTS